MKWEKIVTMNFPKPLGNFFVSGYTAKTVDSAGDMVFLKNVGDRVTLWFRLNQSIDALNGKDNLSITADTSGYDQQFQTERMNFGRGVLIIRYTDHNNNKSKPTIYTNYLEANVSVGADTKVQLFEEGDYEVALDYEVTEDKLIDAVVITESPSHSLSVTETVWCTLLMLQPEVNSQIVL